MRPTRRLDDWHHLGEPHVDPAEVKAFAAASLDAIGLQLVADRMISYHSGSIELTGVEFYSLLEDVSPLLLLHLLPRLGERNRLRNGLQQSYGDHNRLLMYGIDRLFAGDMKWFEQRSAEKCDIQPAFELLHTARFDRGSRVLLWLTAAVHDYGKLVDRAYGLDAEDAVLLLEPFLAALCSPEQLALVKFGVRNHDLVEYVVTGETPPAFVSQQIQRLSARNQSLAGPFLGLIQLAGAASLGEGRVTDRKVTICCDCITGDIFQDPTVECRLARLLVGELRSPFTDKKAMRAMLRTVPIAHKGHLEQFLRTVVVRGWREFTSGGTDSGAADPEARLQQLVHLARLWHDQYRECGFVVISGRGRVAWTEGASPVWQASDSSPIGLLCGTRALVAEPG